MSGIINPATNRSWGQRLNRIDIEILLNGPSGAVLPTITADHRDGSLFTLTTTGVVYRALGGVWGAIGSGVTFLGLYASLVALNAAHPTADPGQYAQVDAGVGSDVQTYIWDEDDSDWILMGSGGGPATWGSITGTLSSQTDLQTALNAKQDTLVSGTNIKTINGSSVLGSGDLTISGGGGGDTGVGNKLFLYYNFK